MRCGLRPKMGGMAKVCEECHGTCRICGRTAARTPEGNFRSFCSQCRTGAEVRTHCSKCGAIRDGAHPTFCLACERDRDRGRDRKAEKARRDQARPYGMSREDLDELLMEQSGRCAGCGATGTRILRPGKTGPKGSLNIDHDHATGKVRGLLCGPCNNAVARVKDDPQVLRTLADYLERSAA